MKYRTRRFSRRLGLRKRKLFRPTTAWGKRRLRTKRIMRAVTRNPRPELKWIEQIVGLDALTNSAGTVALTPVTMALGTDENQRVGRQVSFIKFDTHWLIDDESGQTGVTAPDVNIFNTRVVVWTPRIDTAEAVTYMNTLTCLSHVDFNRVTVIWDKVYWLAPKFVDIGTGVSPNTNGVPNSRYIYKKIPFPRKVHFGGNDNLDTEKYVCYLTFIVDGQSDTTNPSARIATRTKLWYYD